MTTIKLFLRSKHCFFPTLKNEETEQKTVFRELTIHPQKIGVLTVGVWDHHHCKVATQELARIAKTGNEVLVKLRNVGVKIIHGSSTLSSRPEYKPLRNNIKAPMASLTDYGMRDYPPIPIDDSDGGIVEENLKYDRTKVLMHPEIQMDYEKDCMSCHNKEILNYLLYNNIEYLLVFGTHTNMCVLDRTYGIKNLIRFGMKVILIRDLCDVVHNPSKFPFTPREETNERMANYIETYFAPTTHSEDIVIIPESRPIVYVDVDETILTGGYENPKPIQEAIDHYNQMYQEGNIIIYWTARGCVSGKDYLEQTRSQLKQFGVLYHSVRIGKPHYDKLYCDKAYNSILH
jgi:hypothetical protein